MNDPQLTYGTRATEAPSWEDLGILDQSKLREALRDDEEIEPRLVTAAVEHLEAERRRGLLFAVWTTAISVLFVGPVAGMVVWWLDRDVGAAVFVGVFMALMPPLTFGATGLYQAGSSARRLRRLRESVGEPQVDDRTEKWSWRTGRLLTAGFLAFMSWFWTGLLVVGPGLRALDVAVDEDLGAVIGLSAVAVLTFGYYRLLGHRDLM